MKTKELKNYLINSIDLSDYEGSLENTLENVYEIMQREKFSYRNDNELKTIIDWLQGLPSCLALVYTYYDIKELMHSF